MGDEIEGSNSVLPFKEFWWEGCVCGRGAGQHLIELDLRRGLPYRLLPVVSYSF